ncbi:MAG TPA: DUF2059 domain-containing protein [Mucilaginibacter sp.]|jgi:hypothetical protein
MKSKPTLIILIGVLFFSITNLKAQTDSLKITPSHLLAAKELILTTRGTEARFSLMRKNSIETLSKAIPEKNRQKFEDEMNTFFNKYLPFDGYLDITAKMYAGLFTEVELKQLTDFYKSPIGQKVVAVLPQVLQKAMLLDHNLLIEHSDELQGIVNESVKE